MHGVAGPYYAPPNDRELGEACDAVDANCQAGLTCTDNPADEVERRVCHSSASPTMTAQIAAVTGPGLLTDWLGTCVYYPLHCVLG